MIFISSYGSFPVLAGRSWWPGRFCMVPARLWHPTSEDQECPGHRWSWRLLVHLHLLQFYRFSILWGFIVHHFAQRGVVKCRYFHDVTLFFTTSCLITEEQDCSMWLLHFSMSICLFLLYAIVFVIMVVGFRILNWKTTNGWRMAHYDYTLRNEVEGGTRYECRVLPNFNIYIFLEFFTLFLMNLGAPSWVFGVQMITWIVFIEFQWYFVYMSFWSRSWMGLNISPPVCTSILLFCRFQWGLLYSERRRSRQFLLSFIFSLCRKMDEQIWCVSISVSWYNDMLLKSRFK